MANVFDSSSLVDLGADLQLQLAESGADIAINPYGDLVATSQVNNLISAIKRRLFTPKGALGTYVQDVNGLYYIDGEYGNEAYKFLSEPLSNQLLSQMREAIIACLNQEPRITVDSVTPRIQSSPEGIVTVDFIAQYTIVALNTASNSVITFNPAAGTLS